MFLHGQRLILQAGCGIRITEKEKNNSYEVPYFSVITESSINLAVV